MSRLFGLFIVAIMLQGQAFSARADGFQPITPLYQQSGQATSAKDANPLDAVMDNTLGQIMVNSPLDSVSFDQLQSIINQFPNANKIQIQFPNQSQWITSPTELLNVHKQFIQQAGELGFGVGGMSIPALVFSSLTGQSDGTSSDVQGTMGRLAMIPVTNLKGAMSDTLESALKEVRYQQLSLSNSLPDWLKDMMLAIYNFVMPYYYSAVNWVSSFF